MILTERLAPQNRELQFSDQHGVRRVLRSQELKPVGFRIWDIEPDRRAVLGLAEVVLGDIT